MNAMREIANFVAGLYFQNKELIITLALGGVCGLFSQMILPGKGFGIIITIILGIIGCFIGKMYLVKYITFVHSHTGKIIIAGTAGAMALSFIINLFRLGEPKHKDKTKWRNNP